MKVLLGVLLAGGLAVVGWFLYDSMKGRDTNAALARPVAKDGSTDAAEAGHGHAAGCKGASPECLPQHSLLDTDGGKWTPDKLAGKVVVVNVWATWCEPCKREIPAFAAVHKAYAARGVVVLGLLAEYGATLDDIRAFASAHGMSYPIVFMEPEVAESFGNPNQLPVTYIYDTRGNLFKKQVGEFSEAELVAEIKAAGLP